MESIIQSVIYNTAVKDVWCASNVDIPYKKLSNLEKSTYLVRQTFFIKYCKMLYGEELPPVIEDYFKNVKQLLEWEYAILNKYNRPRTEDNIRAEMGLDIASELLCKEYTIDNEVAITYFEYDNPLVVEAIPSVASTSLVKVCLNYWHNLTLLEKQDNNFNIEEINNINIPKIEIDHTTLHVVDRDLNNTFMSYKFNAISVQELKKASPSMYNEGNSLLCLLSCFNWSNKTVSDLFNVFAKNVMTLDVCNERCKRDVFGKYEYRNLWNTGAYYAILKSVTPNIIDTNKFSSCKCPKVITSFLTLISILKTQYELEIDDQDLINTITNYSDEFVELIKNKNDSMSAYDKYNATILPSITGSSEATEEVVEEPKEEIVEVPEEVVEEVPKEEPEEVVEEEPEEEKEPPKEIKSSKKGDKSSKIDIELEPEVTLDVVLLRDEISAFITNTINHPPKNISSVDLEILLKLQQEWLNIFSVQTSLNIINKIMPCPIVVK